MVYNNPKEAEINGPANLFSDVFNKEATTQNIAQAAKAYVINQVGDPNWSKIESHTPIKSEKSEKAVNISSDETLRDTFLRSVIYRSFAEAAGDYPEEKTALIQKAEKVYRVVRALSTVNADDLIQGASDISTNSSTLEKTKAEIMRSLMRGEIPNAAENLVSYFYSLMDQGKEISKVINDEETRVLNERISEEVGIKKSEEGEPEKPPKSNSDVIDNVIVGKLQPIISFVGGGAKKMYIEKIFGEEYTEPGGKELKQEDADHFIDLVYDLIKKSEETNPIKGPSSMYYNKQIEKQDIKEALEYMAVLPSGVKQQEASVSS